jgi:hypothetical protein
VQRGTDVIIGHAEKAIDLFEGFYLIEQQSEVRSSCDKRFA